ncbi:MAG: alpha/beta fold hydrolase [Rhodoglobus sp.]
MAIYDEVSRGVPAETLAAITAPVILVAGEKDSSAITRGSLRRARAEISGAITAIAPGLHHQWNIENVTMFNQSLRAWLTSREAAPGLGTKI